MNQATITYETPTGRKMQRDAIEHSYADILKAARKIAEKPQYRRVCVWSIGGKLLSRVAA